MSTPRDVITAALAVPLPCPRCGTAQTCTCAKPEGYSELTERATLIEAALVEYGFLPREEQPPTDEQTEELAKWFATQTRHPRYTQSDDGWRKLLQSQADVDVAYAAAIGWDPPRSTQEQLSRVRQHLTALIASRRASDTEAS